MSYYNPTIEELEDESAALHQRMLELEQEDVECDGLYDAILDRMAELNREIDHLSQQGDQA